MDRLRQPIRPVQGRGPSGKAPEQLVQVRPEPRVVPDGVIGILELLERADQGFGYVPTAEIAFHTPPAVGIDLEEAAMDRRRSHGKVRPIDPRGPGALHEQRHSERVLGRSPIRGSRRLDARRHVDADHGGRSQRRPDARRIEATGEDHRDLARHGPDEIGIDPDPGATRMRATGRVQQDPRRAGGEVLPRRRDHARCELVRRRAAGSTIRPGPGRGRGQVQDLPDGTVDLRDDRGRFAAAQLDGVGVERHADRVQRLGRQVDRDRHDGRASARRRDGPNPSGQCDRLANLERARRAGHEIQPDRIRSGAHGGIDARGVRDAADLDQRDPI